MGAEAFFEQLTTFSERYFDSEKIRERVSPWGLGGFDNGSLIGAILHYTADGDFARVVKWFMREKYQAKASANVVIADRWMGSTRKLAEDLPLIKMLPVTVVQCRPHTKPTYHATWVNDICYGIEMVNEGELRFRDGVHYTHWPRDHSAEPWTLPFKHPLKEPCKMHGRWWEPYTAEQIHACITLLRNLRALYDGFDPSYVLSHECVQGVDTLRSGNRRMGKDKRDTGPLFPLNHVRKSVFSDDETPLNADWLMAYKQMPNFMETAETAVVQAFAAQDSGLPSVPDADEAWPWFVREMQGNKFGTAHKAALKLLGYHITGADGVDTPEVVKAVRIFQRMAGLSVDGEPGPMTRKALRERLYDRGVIE